MEASGGKVDHRPVGVQWDLPCLHWFGPRKGAVGAYDPLRVRAACRAVERSRVQERAGQDVELTREAVWAADYQQEVTRLLDAGAPVDTALRAAAAKVSPPAAQPRPYAFLARKNNIDRNYAAPREEADRHAGPPLPLPKTQAAHAPK